MADDALRCLRCGLQVSVKWLDGGKATIYWEGRGGYTAGSYTELNTPILCGDCDVPLMVVRECPICKGSGEVGTQYKEGFLGFPCNNCDEGEKLEEQP